MIVLSDFKEPDSAIRHQQNNTKAVMDQRELGVGTLYITESMLSWQGPQGFSIEYPHISLHALSKDTNLYPTECLYLMIDKHVKLPEDKSALQPMYDAIKHCQELHPDPVDASTDEDEAFEDMMEDAYDDMEAAGDGNENVQNMQNLRIGEQQQNGFVQWENKQDMDEDQFEDAD
ncbi:icln [Carabus blaptoides fortunei]